MREVAIGEKTPPEKICRSKSTNQFGERNERLPDLCFSICRFSQVVFIHRSQPHAQSLFLFPIVFGINLIHFFDISTRKNGAAGNSIVCFAASIPCQSRHLTVRRMRTVSKGATFFATESVNSAPFKTLSLSLSLSLSLYLSLCISLSHRMYLTHNLGSASALPIVREVRSVRERYRERERERERERDGSDVTIFALKLAMSLRFPLPKIRTIGDDFTL